MKKSRILSLILALTLSSSLFACGGGAGNEETDTNEETSAEDSTAAQSPIEIVDYKGETINFFLWSQSYLDFTEETGDTINDAVYRRNRKVEDLCNVSFNFTKSTIAAGDFSGWINVVNGEIMAGSDSLGIIGSFGHMFAGESTNGNYVNLNEHIDFTKPWWPSNINKAGNIGNKMFCAFGNMETLYYDQTYALFFNKRLAEECKLENIYELVNNKKWTMDKLKEITKIGGRDLDGNTELNDNDQYGLLIGNSMHIDAFVQAFDVKITDQDNNGYPKLLGLTEHYVDAQTAVSDFVHNTAEVRYRNENIVSLFQSGRGLIASERMGIVHTLREMDDDFGIIPYPMWDEAQGRYITYNAQGNSTAYAIPITSNKHEMLANILNAIAYYGYTDVLPEYYERALKGKAARDNDSEEMLDIIFNNIEYDFTQIYAGIFQTHYSPATMMRDVTSANSDISSYWASGVEYYNEIMAQLIESLK